PPAPVPNLASGCGAPRSEQIQFRPSPSSDWALAFIRGGATHVVDSFEGSHSYSEVRITKDYDGDGLSEVVVSVVLTPHHFPKTTIRSLYRLSLATGVPRSKRLLRVTGDFPPDLPAMAAAPD